eukprot:EG_transcript_8175
MGPETFYFLFMTGGLLVCGTFNSLIAKLIYGLKSTGVNGHFHNFRKPWFQTTNMFLGMTLCMAMYHSKLWAIKHLKRRRAAKAEAAPLLKVDPSDPPPSKGAHLVIIPAIADLAATGLLFTGLVFTTASVYQMLRGAQVIFCCILSVMFLKRKLDWYMKAGVVIIVLGISLVGCASLLRETKGEEEHFPLSQELFGIFLIVVAQLLQAIQMCLEEWLLQDVQMDALELAGWEGIWGGIFCVAVIMPLFQTISGSDMGSLENTEDSLLMLRNNSAIVLAEVLNCFSVLSYNYFGLTLTQDFTAMHRVIIEASRSLLVWICDLLIFYYFSNGTLGESWAWSGWIQLAGFAVLLTGTFTYNYTTLYAEAHLDELAELNQMEELGLPPTAAGRTQSIASNKSRASAISTGSAPLPKF